MAEAARVYLERTNASAATVNQATEIRLLAERQMGEFLKQMPNSKTGPKQLGAGSEPNSVPTIAEIGITKKQSSTAQKLADIPTEEFQERVAVAKASAPYDSKRFAPRIGRRWVSDHIFAFGLFTATGPPAVGASSQLRRRRTGATDALLVDAASIEGSESASGVSIGSKTASYSSGDSGFPVRKILSRSA